ncbi:phage tail protein [Arsenophonus sp. PmNCSU2021_1]|uniref:phage tail protein n=1 Tax=Arsenophonus sp. PmNCSU2021_1 TaxID=3118989 RepID=UPI002FF43B36
MTNKKIDKQAIKQTTGDSSSDVISQLGVTKALDTKQPIGDYVTQLAFNKGLNNKIDKTQLVGTTGNSTDKVIHQKACDELFAKKDSWETFTAGQIKIRSNSDYTRLALIKSDGQILGLETSPNDAYFVYRDTQGNNKAVVTIPSAKNGTLALTADVDAINNYPVGAPIPWPHETAPAGYLICNGQTFTKADYPQLALAYPSGKLPNLYGEFIRGLDLGGKVDPGRKILTNQGDAIRNITGRIGYVRQGELGPPIAADRAFKVDRNLNAKVAMGNNDNWGAVASFDPSRVVPTANENRPRNVAFLYIHEFRNLQKRSINTSFAQAYKILEMA